MILMNKSIELPIAPLDLKNQQIRSRLHDVFLRSYQVEADLLQAKDFPPLRRTAEQLPVDGREFVGYWDEPSQDAELDQRVLAAALELSCANDQLDICSLVVHPDFFRRGIASRLIAHVLTGYSWRRAVVETATANQPAVKLYQKFGFRETRRWMTDFGIEKLELQLHR